MARARKARESAPNSENPPRLGRLTRALRACDLERGTAESPPPPPAEAVAALVRRALPGEDHPKPGVIEFLERWAREGKTYRACQFLGDYLARSAPPEGRNHALKASVALWVQQPPEAFQPLPAGFSRDVGPTNNIPDVMATWAAALDQAASDRALDSRVRDLARRARAGTLKVGDLPVELATLEAPVRARGRLDLGKAALMKAEGKTSAVIAKAQGVSPSTVRSAFARMKNRDSKIPGAHGEPRGGKRLGHNHPAKVEVVDTPKDWKPLRQ